MSALRVAAATAVVTVALVVQVTVFPHLAWQGVVPNLVLLVVVGAGLTRGPGFAATLGLAAGLALDLAPPADHVAGRWALALVLVGYLAGSIRRRHQRAPGASAVVLVVAAASFVGASVFAFTGLLLRDPVISASEMTATVLVAVIWDVLLAPLVLPPVMLLFDRLRPVRVAL